MQDKIAKAELEALRTEIQLGMDDVEAGRLVDFDPEDIIKRGRARRISQALNLKLTPRAVADLDEITDFLESVSSEETAEKFIRGLKKRFDRLLAIPTMGLPRDRLQSGLRVILHHDYAIYYYVDTAGNRLVVLRIIHGARDLQRVIDAGGFERDDDENE